MLISTLLGSSLMGASLIPMQFAVPDFAPATPEIFLLVATGLVLLIDLFLKDSQRFITYVLSQATLLITAGLVIAGFNDIFMAEAMQVTGKASTSL